MPRWLAYVAVFLLSSTWQCLAQQTCGIAAVGDLNGDGNPDIVVANGSLNNIGVFLNTGNGTFGQGAFLGVNNSANSVCLADFNSDGRLDVLVFGVDVNSTPSLHVLFGDGKGGFSAPAVISSPGLIMQASPLVADFNGDGIPDIAFGSVGTDAAGKGPAISVMLGDGKSGFSAPHTTIVAFIDTSLQSIRQFQVLDANKDGKPDLLVGVFPFRVGIPSSYLALGDGQGGFSKMVPLLEVFPGNSMEGSAIFFGQGVADFNGDGNEDFVVTDGELGILYGDGQGGFLSTNFPIPIDLNFFPIAFLDVDGNQTADMVVNGGYLPGNGHGGFGDRTALAFPSGNLIAVADLDGDGTPDFVFQQSGSTNISVFLNHTTAPTSISAPTTTRLTASAATTSVGAQVTLAAKVTSAGGVPVGTATFSDGNTTLGTAPANIYGVAALKTSFSTGGLHTVSASFTGAMDSTTNTVFGNSPSNSVQVSVNNTPATGPAPTVTVIAFPNPGREKNYVLLGNTVSSQSGTPNGFAQILADGNVLDVIPSGPTEDFVRTNLLPPGLHNIQMAFGGDGTFPPATSPTLVEDIRALNVVRSPSTTQVTAVSATQGTMTGFNITVTVSGGTSTPTNVVLLRVDGILLGFTVTPSSSTTFFAASPGTYTVSAEYLGDGALLPSSASTPVVVPPPPLPDFILTVSPQSATINAGQSATFTFTLTPSGGFSSAVSFSCGPLPAGANCTFNPSSLSPSGAAVSSTLFITTTASGSLFVPGSRPQLDGWPTAVTLAFALILMAAAWKGQRARLIASPAALALLLLLASCGGGSSSPPPQNGNPGTPKGTTQITVTATSTTTHSLPITLTVN